MRLKRLRTAALYSQDVVCWWAVVIQEIQKTKQVENC